MSYHIKSNITLNDNSLFNNIRYSHLRQRIRVLAANLGEFSLSCVEWEHLFMCTNVCIYVSIKIF